MMAVEVYATTLPPKLHTSTDVILCAKMKTKTSLKNV
jgi:hypothetical protein